MNTIDITKVQKMVDLLVDVKFIDSISRTMDHGFGEVNCKVTIQNGVIKTIAVSDTKTIKLDQG